MSQIFDNLIGNAARYAGKEGGPIEVEGEKNGNIVRFIVRDHGSGIPAEERGPIFEVFYRGVTGKAVPGTGVGLATVKKIARLYGGNAWAEETPGGGATFCVEMEA
jgi:signal transduction histidine kinase